MNNTITTRDLLSPSLTALERKPSMDIPVAESIEGEPPYWDCEVKKMINEVMEGSSEKEI